MARALFNRYHPSTFIAGGDWKRDLNSAVTRRVKKIYSNPSYNVQVPAGDSPHWSKIEGAHRLRATGHHQCPASAIRLPSLFCIASRFYFYDFYGSQYVYMPPTVPWRHRFFLSRLSRIATSR